jgi:hypothetical protein
MWTTGTYAVTVDIPLDANRTYLVTGGLTQRAGDDLGHVYISMLCTLAGDHVLCGLRGDDVGRQLTETVSSAIRVRLKLRTTGGRHRAEGAIYELY